MDGYFERLVKVFRVIDEKYVIKEVNQLKECVIKEFRENRWENVYFRVYQRKSRKKTYCKIGMKNTKLYLSYVFVNGVGYCA